MRNGVLQLTLDLRRFGDSGFDNLADPRDGLLINACPVR